MTKPAITVPTWATNTNYSVGPTGVPGTATKVDYSTAVANGHIPAGDDGDPNPNPSTAQHMNDYQNRVAQTCQWVLAGSSAGAADAHIVETDSAGTATLKKLILPGAAVGDTLAVTKTASATNGALFTDASVGTVKILANTGTGLIEMGGGAHGIKISSTGDHYPLILNPQTTAPTTAEDGAIYFQQDGTGATRSLDMQTSYVGVREHIPTFASQYLRRTVYDYGISVSPGGGETDIFTGVQWVTRKTPHAANTPLLFTLTFEYSGGTVTDPIDVFIYNGASPVGSARRFYPQNTNTNNETIRVIYASGSLAGASDSYRVAMTANLGIDIDEAVLTIETTE